MFLTLGYDTQSPNTFYIYINNPRFKNSSLSKRAYKSPEPCSQKFTAPLPFHISTINRRYASH